MNEEAQNLLPKVPKGKTASATSNSQNGILKLIYWLSVALVFLISVALFDLFYAKQRLDRIQTYSESVEFGTCSDVSYGIQVLRRDPLVVLLENFITTQEADYLKALSVEYTRSMVTDNDTDFEDVGRTSFTAFLDNVDTSCIEKRVADIVQVDLNNVEPSQIVRYYTSFF
jgi:hypothetical protein